MANFLTLLRLLVAFLLPAATISYKYVYNNQLLKLGHLECSGRVGMFGLPDAPAIASPGDGRSFVHLKVTMTRHTDAPASPGVLQVLLADSRVLDEIGYVDELDTRHYCCTQSLLDKGTPGCTTKDNLGKVVLPKSAHHAAGSAAVGGHQEVKLIDVLWDEGSVTNTVDHQFSVDKTGRYYLLFSSCLNSTGDVTMSGEIVWMNPHGYLPGEVYNLIPLLYCLIIGYLCLGLLWAGLCLVNRKDLLNLQHYISVTILIGLLETCAWYTHYTHNNHHDTPLTGLVLAGVVLSCVKRTVLRMLVLLVCMGHGVMKPSLNHDQKYKLILMGVLYFAFSSMYDIISSHSQISALIQSFPSLLVTLSNMSEIIQKLRTFLLFPVAALDSLLFWWILQEVSSNIRVLTARKQESKLVVYRHFWHILLASSVGCALYAVCHVYMKHTVTEDERWRSVWLMDGMWDAVYYCILLVIACLWRPSEHTADYAHAEQLTAVDDDMDIGYATTTSIEMIAPTYTVNDGSYDSDTAHYT